jgi:hypothetical protein
LLIVFERNNNVPGNGESTMKKDLTRDELDELTRQEWRDLGFFYDQDKDERCWRLVGSRDGLLKFSALLNHYVDNERAEGLSEHEHYGPYWYLKVITWDKAVISGDDITGTLDDLRRLSDLVRQHLENATPGDIFEIDKEYGPNNEFKLRFEIREDGFDPAEPDPLRYPTRNINRSFISRVWSKLRPG